MENNFLSSLSEHFSTKKDKAALIYSSGSTLTYGELDQLSGKIANYLKSKGLGKEDRIVILMPRGIEIIVAMAGCWRAGCTLIVCESNMAVDRVRYIIADSDCKLTVTEDVYAEMLRSDYSPEIKEVDQHDGAYIVYTSGTTGNPKGVLHEYGNIDEALQAKQYNGNPIPRESDTVAINSPLNFVAAVDYIVNLLGAGGTVLLMDTNDVKNSSTLVEVYEEKSVTCTFMTPSLFRSVPKFNSQMDWIILGGEPCVSLSSDSVTLFNGYNMSEAGRDMLLFPIDKAYGLTPVGKNRGGETIVLLDEEDKEVAEGETGEICFPNNYVRGYIGAATNQSGKWRNGVFHTGDLGKRLESGDIVLQGRSDDMIKINGNRIEPAEIEIVCKRELNLGWACAKGFVTPERSFVVLFYKDDVTLDPDEAREVVGRSLTSYMIPSYFVKIDQIPLLPTGKLDKKKLLAPDVNAFKAEYVAPSTESEKLIARAFEKVLGMERIGVNDDFYELGGDSLRSMAVVASIDDPALNVTMIYKNRKVKAIAAAFDQAKANETETPEQRDEAARKVNQPLLPFEQYMLDYQMYSPSSTFGNMPQLWKLPKDQVDKERLLNAFDALVHNHPIFQSKIIVDDNLNFVRQFDPELETKVEIEQVEEDVLKAKILPNLMKPFKLINEPLHRFRVFETENSIYIFMDFHHAFSDGMSLQVMEHNFSDAYYGKPLKHDYSYLFASEENKLMQSKEYLKAEGYYLKKYGAKDWVRNIKPDVISRENHLGIIQLNVGATRKEIDTFLAKNEISLNMLGCIAGLLAIHEKEKVNDVMVSWLYNGRDSILYQDAIGLLIKDLPIGISFDEIHSTKELMESVKEQAELGIENAIYPYIIHTTDIAVNDPFRVRNQGDLMGATCIEGIPLEILTPPDENTATCLMDLLLVNKPDGELGFWLLYNAYCYTYGTAKTVADMYNKYIKMLVNGEEVV